MFLLLFLIFNLLSALIFKAVHNSQHTWTYMHTYVLVLFLQHQNWCFRTIIATDQPHFSDVRTFESGNHLKHAFCSEATGTKIEKHCCRKNTMVISDGTYMSTLHASDLQSTSNTVILLSCVMNFRTWINSVWAAPVLNVVCVPLTVYWQCELPETRHNCNELIL